jgi:hypothetical protein
MGLLRWGLKLVGRRSCWLLSESLRPGYEFVFAVGGVLGRSGKPGTVSIVSSGSSRQALFVSSSSSNSIKSGLLLIRSLFICLPSLSKSLPLPNGLRFRMAATRL